MIVNGNGITFYAIVLSFEFIVLPSLLTDYLIRHKNLQLNMITLKRTNAENSDFVHLVKYLNKELAKIDGKEDHVFYSQFNKIENIKYVLIAYQDATLVGCGAIKFFDSQTMEIKRMYVLDESRGKGIATEILLGLEKWAAELSCKRCVLETGKKLVSAVRLYQKNGYQQISNYGQYVGVESSVCFAKTLHSV